jgi:hypothetical protein
VDLAILLATLAAQKHGPALYEAPTRPATTKVFTTRACANAGLADQAFARAKPVNLQQNNGRLRKTG